jgi:hypothetical protein
MYLVLMVKAAMFLLGLGLETIQKIQKRQILIGDARQESPLSITG